MSIRKMSDVNKKRQREAKPLTQREASTPTRQRIMGYLQEHHTASAVELAQAWGLTRANLRYHLKELLQVGLIEAIARNEEQASGRGRPVQYYRLAAGAQPGNLAGLCDALLVRMLDGCGAAEREAVLRGLAEHMAKDFVPADILTRRYNESVAFLNRLHYHARWEASARGPRILLRSCPYAAVLADHPALCQLDRYLLEALLQMPLQQCARVDRDSGDPAACVFSAKC